MNPFRKVKAETQDKDKDVLQEINWKQDVGKNQNEKEDAHFEKNWSQYANFLSDDFHIPKTKYTTWTILAEIINLLLVKELPIFDVSPRGSDDRLEAQKKTSGLSYEMYRIPDFRMSFIKSLMQVVISGKGWFNVGWDDEEKRLAFPFILNKDILYDPTANLISEVKWVNRKILISKKELEKRGKDGKYENVKTFLSQAKEHSGGFGDMTETNPYKDQYLIMECWDKEKEGGLITVGMMDGKATHKFRKQDNPHNHGQIPFTPAVLDPKMKGIDGFGIPEVMVHLQDETDEMRRLRIQAIKFAILGMWGYTGSPSQEAKEGFQHPTPGMLVPMKGWSVENLNKGGVPRDLFVEEDVINKDIEDLVTTPPTVRGGMTERKETLGGLQIQQSGALKGQMAHILVFSTAIQRVGRQMLQLLFQYQDKEIMTQIWDEDEQKEKWEKFKMQDDDANEKEYNIILRTGISPYGKDMENNWLLKLIQVFSQPAFVEAGFDLVELGKRVMGNIDPKLEHSICKFNQKDKIFAQLRKLPVEHIQQIVSTGMQVMKVQSQMQEGQEGGRGALQTER